MLAGPIGRAAEDRHQVTVDAVQVGLLSGRVVGVVNSVAEPCLVGGGGERVRIVPVVPAEEEKFDAAVSGKFIKKRVRCRWRWALGRFDTRHRTLSCWRTGLQAAAPPTNESREEHLPSTGPLPQGRSHRHGPLQRRDGKW